MNPFQSCRTGKFAVWQRLVTICGTLLACSCSAKPRPIGDYQVPVIQHEGKSNGLEIDIIANGRGQAAKSGDLLRVHYITTLEDKTPIDSSHSRKPLLIRLGDDSNFIEGLHRGLSGIKTGELRRLRVPPQLGYRGQKLKKIPPDVNLIFYLELMEIVPQ